MNTRFSLAGTSLTAALLTSTAAFADVTPDDVWGSWKSYMEGMGYAITATENGSGNALTVSGLEMNMQLPDDAGSMSMTMGDMTFTGQGDGTVAVTLPDAFPFHMHMVPASEYDEEVEATIDYAQSGFSMVVSGDPDRMTFTLGADSLSMKLADLVVDGEPVDTMQADIAMTDVSGSMNWATGAMVNIHQVFDAGNMTYAFHFEEPENEGMLTFNGHLSGIKSLALMTMPAGGVLDMAEFNDALKAGLSINVEYAYDGGALEFAFKDNSDQAQGSSSSSGGSLTMAMSSDALGYGFGLRDYALSLTSSEIPLPINLSSSELAMNFSVPVSKSDTPQDFSALVKLIGFAPDAMIWGIADPGGVLPHDPADLVIDLKGKANWFFDIMDPAQAELMSEVDIPGALHALTLNDLRVKLAGAELTGIGDFTFDMSDLETFDGMPAPDGALDLRLVGGNGLLDRLIQMGLVSEDDAMGARMMMGMFGRPGEGEDEILSTIEVKANGEISANGQRLQ